MIKTFYHTGHHAYITADVVDLGMVGKMVAGPPAIGGQLDAIVTAQAGGQHSKANWKAVVKAARERPDTIDGLISRTGQTRHTVAYAIRQGRLVKVGKVPGEPGNWRSVWGVSC